MTSWKLKDSKAYSTTIFQEMLILFKGHVVEKKQPGNIAVAAIDDMQITPLQASRVMLLDSHVTLALCNMACDAS